MFFDSNFFSRLWPLFCSYKNLDLVLNASSKQHFFWKVFQICVYSQVFAPQICSKFLSTLRIAPFFPRRPNWVFLGCLFLGFFRYLTLCQIFDNFKHLVLWWKLGDQCWFICTQSRELPTFFGSKNFSSLRPLFWFQIVWLEVQLSFFWALFFALVYFL